MSSSNSNSLRPAWNRGNSKGFHPPPQVEQQQLQQQLQRNQSNAKVEDKQRDYNKFSALNDDDDIVALIATTASDSKGQATAAAAAASASGESINSRSEALRSRNSSFGANKATGGGGRSLADLAARAPERTPSRFSNIRKESPGTGGVASSVSLSSSDQKPVQSAPVVDDTVVRFTRERLLSLRPSPLEAARDHLQSELEGSLILSEKAQDPVCWDSLDAEELWATVVRRIAKTVSDDSLTGARRTGAMSIPTTGVRREVSTSGGRWQRGVALPPEGTKRSSSHKDIDDPSDLWDDPGANDGAAMDFSAFGAMPDDGSAVFDFEKMAQASKKLEEEMHGRRSRASSNATTDVESEDNNGTITAKMVNPSRPLATAGTTIRSGSGENVNVFEDFDDPAVAALAPTEDKSESTATGLDATGPTHLETAKGSEPGIKSATEDPTASSRLMAMIGVRKDDSTEPDAKLRAWGEPAAEKTSDPAVSSLAGIPLNPWGGPVIPMGSNDQQHQQGLDLQLRLRQVEMDQQQQQLKAAEENRRRLEQEETQRRQLQEQDRARTMQQQAGVQSQVELVLMERISTILENSWGRSDLVSILATLHAEDSRVIPLLSNVEALRTLLLRNPRRVALRQDASLRAEMAALLVTNVQWQQHQQQQQALLHQQQLQQQEQQQQEEKLLFDQQRRVEEQKAAIARSQQQQLVSDTPWFYSDPSKNIQGPFRGEEMRQWLEAGYFKGDLPISQNENGPFRPLSMIFSDLSVAFMNPSASEDAELRAKGDEQQRREMLERVRIGAEAAERERLREKDQQRQSKELKLAERQAREELEKRAQKAARAADVIARTANGGNESSTQLKMMLGLGAQSTIGADQQVEPPKSSKKTIPSQQKAPSETSSAASESAIQSSKSAPTAWGGATKSQPATKKSMSEIQKEEARAAAVAAMNRTSAPTSSSAWANVAAARGGSTAWTGGEAKQQPAVILPGSGVGQTGIPSVISPQPTNVPTQNVQAAVALQRANSISLADPTSDAFGAKMPSVLEKWCKDQMQKLNGTDDLTLVHFCMSLTDADEIRQYLTAYLGSTPQVNSFATEFIHRKGGAKEKTEEWEPLVKKGRKKKA